MGKALSALLLAYSLHAQILVPIMAGNPTAVTPTFSPGAGTYTGTQSVTISSSPCGSYVYWSTVHNPPTTADTNGTSVSVSSSETVYAIVIGCPGYANSAVGSAAYTINVASLSVVNATNGATASQNGNLAATAISHTAGNTLVALISQPSTQCSTSELSSVSNTAGDTWTLGTQFANNSATTAQKACLQWAYILSTAGNASDIVTAHFSANAFEPALITVYQIAGVTTGIDLTPTGVCCGSGGSPSVVTSASFTTGHANEIILWGQANGSTTTYTAGAIGGTTATIPSGASSTTSAVGGIEYRIVSTVQTGITAASSAGNFGTLSGFLLTLY